MTSFAKLANAAAPVVNSTTIADLNWRSEVIETVPHGSALKSPVVTAVNLQPTGNLLAIAGDDHYVCIYDTTSFRYLEHLKQHSDWIRSARFSPNGQTLATAGNDRKLLIWDINDWTMPAVSKRNPEAIFQIAFSHDGSKIATVGFESTLRLFDVADGSLIDQMELPSPDNHAVAFSNDDRLMAAGGRCGNVRVWDMQANRKLTQFKAHRQRIRSLEFTPDNLILSAGDDQIVKITDPNNVADERKLPRHASKLYATALMHDGLVATGGSDNKIHVWNLKTLQEVGTLQGHTGTVSCLDYSKSRLVSGSYDTHVRLWSTEQNTSAPEQRHTELRDGWNRSFK